LHLGWVYYKKGDSEEAEEAFRKILNKNPKNFQARYFLAATLIEEGRKEEAKEELTYILEESSKEEIAYNWAEEKLKELKGES
ncbi:MAG TPA: tetratricopeptide repeat protein, partial [Candidatus Atribacteria bacterium]|nr:tetratricopeptide repeat protein [Candidatus Atribacteria bacterium]